MNQTQIAQLQKQWAVWQATQPNGADTSLEAFLSTNSQAPREEPGFAQKVNSLLGEVSTAAARFDPRMLVAGSPMSQTGLFAPKEQQLEQLKDPSTLVAKDRIQPDTVTLANAGRELGNLLDVPGQSEFADIGQRTMEGGPRMAAAAAAGGVPLIGDMALQGYAGAKDSGATTPQALGAGAVSAGVGAIMPAFAGAGKSIAAQTMARTAVDNPIVQRGAEAIGSNLAMLVPQAVQKPATELVTGKPVSDPLDEKNLLELGLSNLALAPLSAREVIETPRVTAADGRVIKYPSATALEKVKLSLQRAAATQDKMARLYIQFMEGASEAVSPLDKEMGPPTLGRMTARIRQKAYDTTGSLSAEEKAALSPLRLLRPSDDNPVAQEAHDAFVKAAGLDTSNPDFSLVRHVGGVVGERGPKQPLMSIDFGDTKQLTPLLFLDRVIAGEIAPTGAQAQDVANAELLRRVFAPQSQIGEDFVDMDRVNDLAGLAGRIITKQATPDDLARWNKPQDEGGMDNATKEASVLAAKILADPYSVAGKDSTTGGLDPIRWSAQPIGVDVFGRMVKNAAGTLYKKWDSQPITTVEDAGALVRDVNFFIDNVKGFLDQQGFSEEAQNQLHLETDFAPITKKTINEKYGNALQEYLEAPNAEAAARTLQWVKNQVLLTAQTAKRAMMEGPLRSANEPNSSIAENRSAKDPTLDAEFNSAIKNVGPNAQKLLSDLYVTHRAETVNDKGEALWGLDSYRRSVARTLARMTPEQKAALDSIPNPFEGLDQKYVEMYLKRDKKIVEALPKEERIAYDKTVTAFEDARSQIEPALRKIPAVLVEVTEPVTRGGKVKPAKETRKITNLGKLLFEPTKTRVADYRLGGFNPVGADMVPKGPKSLAAEAVSQATEANIGDKPEAGHKLRDVSNVAAPSEEQVMPEHPKIKEFFTGTPSDPQENLNKMTRLQFEAMYETIYGEKSWKAKVQKFASVVGKTPNEVRNTPAVTEWMKDFLRAELGGAAERADWMQRNASAIGTAKTWKDAREAMIGKDSAKELWLKARLMGLELKPGVSPDQVAQVSKTEKAAPRTPSVPKAKFEYDVLTAYNQHFLEAGYQPELSAVLSNTLSKMTKNFTWLDNAEFAMLTDKKAVVDQFFKDLQVLGVHIPANTVIGGRPVANPIIAVAMKDFVDNKSYAALNGFLKVSVLAHEAFHAFKNQVVNNPEAHRLNEDSQAQVAAFRQMEKLSQSLNPEDRLRVASSLVDLMIPPKYTRDAKGAFRPEIKGIISAVSKSADEFMAFYYQIVATGAASKIANDPTTNRGTSEIRDAMQWLSKDEQSFLRGQFRYLGDMLGALQAVLDDPSYRESQGFVSTMKEERQVVPPPETQGSLKTFAQGQATEVPPQKPETVTKKFNVTRPPTEGVGMTARQLAESAAVIAKGPQSSARETTPGLTEVQQARSKVASLKNVAEMARVAGASAKELAKIDARVQRAETALKIVETNFGSADVAEQLAKGVPLKQVDISDIAGTKSEMMAYNLPQGATNSHPSIDESSAFLEGKGPDKQWVQSIYTRFLSPLTYRAQDLKRRGLEQAEAARQVLDRIQPQAHLINHVIMDPVTKRFGNFESVRLDTTHDFFKFISDGDKTDPAARKALNNILRMQQTLKGVDVNDPQMQQTLKQELATVPPPKRALVVTAVRTINEIYANKATQQLKAATESQRNIIAALAMRMVPGKLSSADAKQMAYEAIRVSETGDIAEYHRFQQQMQFLGMSPAQSQALAQVAATSYERITSMHQQMKALGNFASEQRVGRYVLAYDMGGERKYEGIMDESEGASRQQALIKQGGTNFKKIDKSGLADEAQAMNSYEGQQAMNDIVNETFAKQVQAVRLLDPTIAEFLQKSFNPAQGVAEYQAVSAAQKNMLRRNLAGGRETVDYVETMLDNVSRTSVSLARRSAREEYTLLALELEQMGQGTLVKDLNKHLTDVMTPESPAFQKFKSFVTAFHVVNISNFMLENIQMLSSGNSELFREGLTTKGIFQNWNKAMQDYASWHTSGRQGSKLPSFKSLADLGEQIDNSRFTAQPMLENRDAAVAAGLRRMNDEGRMGHEPLLDVNGEDILFTNLARATRQNDFSWAKAPEIAGNSLYQMSRNMLRLYGIAPRMNNWLAGHAALQAGYDKGLRGNDLYTYAIGLKDAMTVSGGRANRPLLYTLGGSNQVVRPIVGMATMLSNYSLGMMSIMGHSLKDAVAGSPGLSPDQRIAAGKSAANALAVQLSLSGALGMPLAGAAIYLIEQLFRVDAEKKMREIATLGFGDDFGAMVSDIAMNGWVNRLTGLDVAGKAGINSLFGINGYNGFDPTAMLGPSVSVVKDVWNAVQDASQGEGLKAATKLAPKGVRGLVDTARSYKEFGDLRFMDASNNLIYQPDKAETLGYAMGFQPAGAKRAKQISRLVTTSDTFFNQKNNRELDNFATGLLKGNNKDVLRAAYDRSSEPNFDAKAFIANVVDRAVNMEVEKDPTGNGPLGNIKSRHEINDLKTGQNREEIRRTLRKGELLGQLGNPLELQMTQKDLLRAMVVDELRAQKHMTRQEALMAADKLLGN